MIRLRGFAASARQARLRGFAATASPTRFRLGMVVMMAAAIVFGGSSSAFACPVCFGAEETSMIDGAKLGIMVMLGITFAVQGAFVAFFIYLRKRAKRIADVELDTEWSELQRAR
jgi:heme/copper-type cytochrome/quinol oxidase subunit 2